MHLISFFMGDDEPLCTVARGQITAKESIQK